MSQRQKVVWRNARAALLVHRLAALDGAWSGDHSVLTGNVVDAATKAPVADVVVTATSPACKASRWSSPTRQACTACRSCLLARTPCGSRRRAIGPSAGQPSTWLADRTLRLNVELLPETAGHRDGDGHRHRRRSSTSGPHHRHQRQLGVHPEPGRVPAGRVWPARTGPSTRWPRSPRRRTPTSTASASTVRTSPENLYLIDGLSVNNPAYGTLGTPLTSEFVDEVNVITGGYMPEYGRTTGGAISAVTKSGGNEFHGSIFGTFTPGGLGRRARDGRLRRLRPSRRRSSRPTSATSAQPSAATSSRTGCGSSAASSTPASGTRTSATSTAPTPRRGACSRRSKTRTSGGSVTSKSMQLHRQAHLPHQPRPPHQRVRPGHADHRRRRRSVLAARREQQPRHPRPELLHHRRRSTASWHQDQVRRSRHQRSSCNSSFLDKKLLLDIRAGWHHQKDEHLPGDGSTLADIDNVSHAGRPAGGPARASAATNIPHVDDRASRTRSAPPAPRPPASSPARSPVTASAASGSCTASSWTASRRRAS